MRRAHAFKNYNTAYEEDRRIREGERFLLEVGDIRDLVKY